MPDREKVISDIEQQIRWIEEIECHKFPGWLNVTNAMRDALALLKEQEAVEPIITPWLEDEDGNIVVAKKECGNCGCQFFTERPNFCENCGTPILWEGRRR